MDKTQTILGTNVQFKQEGNIAWFGIDVTKRGGRTGGGEGKNISVASTGGNITIPGTDGVKLGLNAYVKA